MITQGHARMLTSVLGVSRTITARHDNRYPTLPGRVSRTSKGVLCGRRDSCR
jgi:hypothetical protein